MRQGVPFGQEPSSATDAREALERAHLQSTAPVHEYAAGTFGPKEADGTFAPVGGRHDSVVTY